jgi:hypothetical protein
MTFLIVKIDGVYHKINHLVVPLGIFAFYWAYPDSI